MGEIFGLPYETVVLDICGADVKKRSGNGESVITCPIVPDKDFSFNFAKGVFNCFKGCINCPVSGCGNSVDMVCLYHDCSRDDAVEILKNYSSSRDNAAKIAKRKQIPFVPVKTIKTLDADSLNAVYTEFLDSLELSEIHEIDLLKRGLRPEHILSVGFKSLPQVGHRMIARRIVEKGLDIKGVPGFYTDNIGPTINCNGSGYFIPYRDEKDRIVALQIRYDVDLDGTMTEEEKTARKKKRYRWFTSSTKENGASSTTVPFYGLPGSCHKSQFDKGDKVYATEGGLKAAVAQSISGRRFVAIPGIRCFSAWRAVLATLKEDGVTTVVDAFDMDRYTNENVMNSIEKLKEIAKDEFGIELYAWNWDPEFKGVDDYFLHLKENGKFKNVW